MTVPLTETIFAIALVGGLVLIVAALMRAANLRSFHRTLTTAIEQGSPEVPALIERLGRRPRVSFRLIAYVLLAITAAMLGTGLLEGNLKDLKEVAVAAMFPGFVAVAILLHLRRPDPAGDA